MRKKLNEFNLTTCFFQFFLFLHHTPTGKAFDITYIRVKFQSPRPESFAIYKRTSENGPWVPYQYYRLVIQPLDGERILTTNPFQKAAKTADSLEIGIRFFMNFRFYFPSLALLAETLTVFQIATTYAVMTKNVPSARRNFLTFHLLQVVMSLSRLWKDGHRPTILTRAKSCR